MGDPLDGRGLRELTGQTVGRYRLESILGQGGMGLVFRARHLELDRPVAVKFLLSAALNHDQIKRFQREITVQKSLEHPTVVRIFDADVHGENPYIVMELIEGGSLRDWLREGTPTIAEIVEVGAQLFESLVYLHEMGVLHRDLKPANVLRSEGNRVRVTDFGLARLDHQTLMTTPGMVLGTLTHLAPEVLVGHEHTPAADRYAAGLILYEMVTGALPFRYENPSQWIWAVEKIPVTNPGRPGSLVPEGLQRLIVELLAKDPAARPTSDAALGTLRSLVEERLEPDRPRPRRPVPGARVATTTRPARRRWPPALAAVLLFGAAYALTVRSPESQKVMDVKKLFEEARRLERSKEPGAFERSLSLYQESAARGSADAHYHLGYLADVGEGIAQDPAEAARRYRQAMERGHPDAEARLAVLYFSGRGVPFDLDTGLKHLTHAAEAGSTLGASWLGTRLLIGSGIPADHGAARRWLERGAAGGEPEAQCNMGVLFERGFGVPVDLAQAAAWYRRSADQGYAIGRFNLGMLKLRGSGVDQDVIGAVALIRAAAEVGTVEAQDCLGRLHMEGLGVTQDPALAATWLARAADAGFVPALEALGQLHEEGKGVPRDLDKAVFLYKRAQEGGSTWALTKLTNMKLGTEKGLLDPDVLGVPAPPGE